MYVCGPTVYDRAHLGNARPVIVFDVLSRLLRRHYTVRYVRNITDIDDKIINRANETGEDIRLITDRTTKLFHEDMAALGNLPPDIEPRATDHITSMILFIASLIHKGHAYEAEGHVLFDVSSNPRHGSLMGIDPDTLKAGARVEKAPYKRNPEDFVLWKPSPPGWPSWWSPWGDGRPGWHIECSAMASKHLGNKFDIHGGGLDLAFPHHECENAQTTCTFGTDRMANVWMHNGLLTVNGKKMSKSLGNFITVDEILKHGHWAGEAFRFFTLKTHYRSPLDYTVEGLMDARKELDGFYRKVEPATGDVPEEFEDALARDLNVPGALAIMHAEKDPQKLFLMGQAIGLFTMERDVWFRGDSNTEIEEMIAARNIARAKKEWAESDKLRASLLEIGVVLEDSAAGTTWRRV